MECALISSMYQELFRVSRADTFTAGDNALLTHFDIWPLIELLKSSIKNDLRILTVSLAVSSFLSLNCT